MTKRGRPKAKDGLDKFEREIRQATEKMRKLAEKRQDKKVGK